MRLKFVPITQLLIPLLFLIIFFASIASFFLPITETLTVFFASNRVESIVGLTFAMAIATVIAPIALFPIIPIIAPMLGPFTTAVACWLGWTFGSVVAFCIARYGGRPLIARFTSLEKLDTYEKRVPLDAHFVLIFALRIVVPVDVLSYALGFFSTVSLKVYAAASALGILWFSFAFAYIGYALKTGNTVLFLAYSVASAIIFLVSFWYAYRTVKRTPKNT